MYHRDDAHAAHQATLALPPLRRWRRTFLWACTDPLQTNGTGLGWLYTTVSIICGSAWAPIAERLSGRDPACWEHGCHLWHRNPGISGRTTMTRTDDLSIA